MSLILEALKKSEQQRQQKHSTQQQVRKRTLSLSSTRSGRRSYYLLLAVLVSLVFLGAGWFYKNMLFTAQQAPAVALTPSAPPAISQPKTVEPGMKPAEAAGTPPQAATEAAAQEAPKAAPQAAFTVEPAPVPREFVDPPDMLPRMAAPVPVRTTPKKSREQVSQPRQLAAIPPAVAQQKEQAAASAPPPPGAAADDRVPLYEDLSEELRARMPELKMSMHFYVTDPDRRLVRINGRLLREGAWLSDNLQLIEITPDGATLDYLGKAFEIKGSTR
jgi:general secretion pathway protein B